MIEGGVKIGDGPRSGEIVASDQMVFDPEREASQILALPRDEKAAAYGDFLEKYAEMELSIADFITGLITDVQNGVIEEDIQKKIEESGFTAKIKANLMKSAQRALNNREKISKIIGQNSLSDPAFCQNLAYHVFNFKPMGAVTILNHGFVLEFIFEEPNDFSRSHGKKETGIAGFFAPSLGANLGLSNAVISATRKYSDYARDHELFHAFHSLAEHPSPELEIPGVSKDGMIQPAMRLIDFENFIKREAITQELQESMIVDRYIDFVCDCILERNAKNEICAYFITGRSALEIDDTLIGSPDYDYIKQLELQNNRILPLLTSSSFRQALSLRQQAKEMEKKIAEGKGSFWDKASYRTTRELSDQQVIMPLISFDTRKDESRKIFFTDALEERYEEKLKIATKAGESFLWTIYFQGLAKGRQMPREEIARVMATVPIEKWGITARRIKRSLPEEYLQRFDLLEEFTGQAREIYGLFQELEKRKITFSFSFNDVFFYGYAFGSSRLESGMISEKRREMESTKKAMLALIEEYDRDPKEFTERREEKNNIDKWITDIILYFNGKILQEKYREGAKTQIDDLYYRLGKYFFGLDFNFEKLKLKHREHFLPAFLRYKLINLFNSYNFKIQYSRQDKSKQARYLKEMYEEAIRILNEDDILGGMPPSGGGKNDGRVRIAERANANQARETAFFAPDEWKPGGEEEHAHIYQHEGETSREFGARKERITLGHERLRADYLATSESDFARKQENISNLFTHYVALLEQCRARWQFNIIYEAMIADLKNAINTSPRVQNEQRQIKSIVKAAEPESSFTEKYGEAVMRIKEYLKSGKITDAKEPKMALSDLEIMVREVRSIMTAEDNDDLRRRQAHFLERQNRIGE